MKMCPHDVPVSEECCLCIPLRDALRIVMSDPTGTARIKNGTTGRAAVVIQRNDPPRTYRCQECRDTGRIMSDDGDAENGPRLNVDYCGRREGERREELDMEACMAFGMNALDPEVADALR